MKLLLTADLHRSRTMYKQLVEAVQVQAPDVLCLVGDTVNDGDSSHHRPSASEYAALLSSLEVPRILFTEGNHDVEAWTDFVGGWTRSAPIEMLAPGMVDLNGFKIAGLPCEISGADLSLSGQSHTDSFIESWLEEHCVAPSAPSLWLLHEPPKGFGITAATGAYSGSDFWRRQILKYRPPVVFTGHIHDVPFTTGIWHSRRFGSLVINVGQLPGRELSYCLMELLPGADGSLSLKIEAPKFSASLTQPLRSPRP